MGDLYNWLRGLHIAAVMAWMAAFLILPRLFVYHMSAEPGSKMEAVFINAERRVMSIIMNPAMIVSLILGLALIHVDAKYIRGGYGFLLQPWMIVKLSGVIFLLGWHGFLSASRKRFAQGKNTRSERFWRLSNEIPFVVGIVMILAVTVEFGGH
jgi:putative membrane protein